MPNIWQTPISSTPDSKRGRYSGRGDVESIAEPRQKDEAGMLIRNLAIMQRDLRSMIEVVRSNAHGHACLGNRRRSRAIGHAFGACGWLALQRSSGPQ